jgi:prepilin-type N-terminal cleavage/methylation domain-containing protein
MYSVIKLLLNKKIPGFSLLEVSIVLIIMGVMAGAVLKGHELLERSKLTTVIEDFKQYTQAIILYQETYSALPGDDNSASTHFGSTVENGNGNHIIDDHEESLFWEHLSAAKLISSPKSPVAPLGGIFNVKNVDGVNYITLSKPDFKGGLTPKQALSLKKKARDGNNPNEGHMIVQNGEGELGCINGDQFNLSSDKTSCVIMMSFP